MAEWNVVAIARNEFADMLADLDEEQLHAQSLCEQWSVLDVAGHLVSLVEVSPLKWVIGSLKSRDDLDGLISAYAKQYASWGAERLTDSLRAHAGKRMRPYSESSMVNDTAVHTLDVRRPLGIDHDLDDDVLKMALDFSCGELQKNHGTTVRLVADDLEWSWGTGDEVHGRAESLLLALNKRDVAAEVDGPGVPLLP